MFHKDMKIWIVSALQLWVKISVSSILTLAIQPDVPQPALSGVVCIEILQVLQLRVANFGSGLDEIVFGTLGSKGPTGDIDGAIEAVMLLFARAMISFQLPIS